MKKHDIKELIKIFSSANISRMKLKQSEFEIELEKGTISSATSFDEGEEHSISIKKELPKPTQKDKTEEKVLGDVIKSPMVGTFYQAPAPGAPSFVKVGMNVSKGQSIAIIEAMKIMNEIEAEFDCKIKTILVSDGQPVEFGMPLFEVEKI